PRRFFVREAERLGLGRLEDTDLLGTGMFFLPQSDTDGQSERCIESAISTAGLRLLGWRDVPIDAEQLGEAAHSTLPRIRQALIVPTADGSDAEGFEQALYLVRKDIERCAERAGLTSKGFYVVSLSCRTLVYKG